MSFHHVIQRHSQTALDLSVDIALHLSWGHEGVVPHYLIPSPLSNKFAPFCNSDCPTF